MIQGSRHCFLYAKLAVAILAIPAQNQPVFEWEINLIISTACEDKLNLLWFLGASGLWHESPSLGLKCACYFHHWYMMQGRGIIKHSIIAGQQCRNWKSYEGLSSSTTLWTSLCINPESVKRKESNCCDKIHKNPSWIPSNKNLFCRKSWGGGCWKCGA